ncbi:cytochrome c oxidase subunit II [Paraconexibacter antarcticus]|uniref:Cytochrome c oxidase subunit 2 n=1 Tax=Paraconexibacter antarcticus TaxID=2949664 RepID=A0ABY5DZQ5_9ACTN|nr:cytochrome c oxidase subunit II [Paraconexibacter antarcticus]UTI67015.1 cytochrome c oxidase subunit II [Paraconexibacter antarcticus]
MRPNRFTSSRRRLALAAVAVGVLCLLETSTASAFFTPESGGSPNADKIDTLYKLILAVAVVVFVGVEGALFYCLWKFKAKKGAVAAQIHGNTRLEIGWTVGAAVILVVLAGFTFAALPGIRNPQNTGPNGYQTANGVLTAGTTKRLPPNGKSLNIDVNGQQYVWRFTYPDKTPNTTLDNPFSYEELVVPVDTAITLDIRAQDVAHSWWIPKLGGKFDAIPGYTNHTWFRIPAKLAGQSFTGQCAELCGRNHANMIARVKAVTATQFEQFLADQKTNTEAADKAAAVARKAFEKTLSTNQSATP